MKLIPVTYHGFTAMDKRFSSPMLPWIVSEIRKRGYSEKLSLGVEDGILQAYNQDFELQFAHKVSQMTRFSQADLDPCTFLYLLRDDYENLLYCYLFQAKKTADALHMIDAVLDPMVRSSGFAPSAYDFLQDVHKWNFGGAISVTKFFDKVQLYELVDLYDKIPHTFFIPIDSGMNLYKYEMITKKIVRRHVVRHQVAFSRPQGRVVTNIDDAGSLYQFSFEKINNTLFVKCVSNYSTHITQYSVKVLVPDIPMRNGVVHLISEPLGNFFEILRPLPYLPIIEKVTNDIEIDVFYQMGNATGFNNVFDRKGVNFTYFVPKDSAWYKTSKLGLEPIGSFKNILSRHLVISKEPYSMQQLVWMTRDNHYRPIKLMSERGPLRISVFEIEDQYLIKWRKKYIKVLRPDYLCTNGIVHILSGPFVKFRQQKLERYNDSSKVSNYWKIVNDIHT